MKYVSGGVLWSSKINDDGFMGFVDKWWMFWNRVSVIVLIVCLCVSAVSSLIALFIETKETFYTSRLRHQNKRYT